MKTIIALGIAVAILGATGSSTFAQTQSTSTTTTNYIQTSKLIGTTVKGPQGDAIGQIKDVVLDSNGCMAYTVVSTGGTGTRVSGSSKTVAVPWSVYSTTSDPKVVTVRVEKEKIYNAPAFDYARINEYSTGGYISNINSYYGVSGGTSVGFNAGVSNTTSTTSNNAAVNSATTNTNTSNTANTAGANGSPVSSVTPSATAAASATPVANASPSPSASASASATASPSSRKSKAHASPSAKRQSSDRDSNTESSESARPSRSASDTNSDEGSASSSKSTHKKHRASSEEPGSETKATPGDQQGE